MDYSQAALKLFCDQLKTARQTQTQPQPQTTASQPSCSSFTLAGILFQRAWLQGILVSTPNDSGGRFLLDDGTGVIEVLLSAAVCNRGWEVGKYVMVVGGYVARENDLPSILAHKIVDLSLYPDREAMWYLEVIEAFKLFYQPIFED